MSRLSARIKSTVDDHHFFMVALVMMLLFSRAHASAAETKASTIVTPDSSWSSSISESKTYEGGDGLGYIKCAPNKVMVGREHDEDENGNTRHKCASLNQNDTPLSVNTKPEHTAKYDDEFVEYKFACPTNEVMTGRGHYYDEHGPTWYFCGTVTDAWGDPMQVGNRSWTDDIKESDSSYTCPSGTVMTGRGHRDDENGWTQYQCATLY
ncbi:hypothetical protein BSG18_55710 [Pseudomonas ogarae]|nr:hypothetical protein BSF43_58000 [Pseudomonas ogarae]PBJ16875.1 hypothetical protein BSG18_55710 [Pseudomonas ogarae]